MTDATRPAPRGAPASCVSAWNWGARELRYVHNLSGIRGHATENAHITEVMHAAPACA